MPLRNAIIGQPIIGSIIAVVVEIALLHSRRFGVGVDVAQGIQRSFVIAVGKSRAVIPLFPEMPRPVQHPVKAHGCVPVEPVHNLGQIFRVLRFYQVMHVVAHDAQGIELKVMNFTALLDTKQQQIAAFYLR